jgi:hypothetical protein
MGPAGEWGRNNLNDLKIFALKMVQVKALTALFVPDSLDSGWSRFVNLRGDDKLGLTNPLSSEYGT